MYHNSIDLQTIARAHQEDLLDSSARVHLGRLTPSLFTRGRRGIGLAMIAAGERLADRRSRRPAPSSAASPAAAKPAVGHAQ